jgi:hypothetical protein
MKTLNNDISKFADTNEELIYEIIKRLIILINENLPKKITNSKEFEEIIFFTETLKKRIKSD